MRTVETIENRDIQQLLHDGISQFNNGEFFEAHETLESAWRMETSPSKEVIQALIQFSVGWHHLKRKNWVGAEKVFSKARSNLVVFGGASCFVNCKEIIYQLDILIEFIQCIKKLPMDAIELPDFPHLSLSDQN